VFNLWDVVLIVVVAIFALLVSTRAELSVLRSLPSTRGISLKDIGQNALLLLPTQLAAYLLTIGFMVFYVWERYRTEFLKAVRWNMPGRRFAWRALAGGVALGATSQVLYVLLHRWIPKSLPIDEYFRTMGSAYALAAFAVLVAPVVEELFFRGFLYPALARPLGVVPAIAVTAGLFALLHSQQLAHAWAPLFVLLIVGTVLTVVRAVTKSVAMCVLIHMAYNFTLVGSAFVVTQGFRHLERA
jgi:membrane protease YdiL (CAAX protease family)